MNYFTKSNVESAGVQTLDSFAKDFEYVIAKVINDARFQHFSKINCGAKGHVTFGTELITCPYVSAALWIKSPKYKLCKGLHAYVCVNSDISFSSYCEFNVWLKQNLYEQLYEQLVLLDVQNCIDARKRWYAKRNLDMLQKGEYISNLANDPLNQCMIMDLPVDVEAQA